jgi:site-specific recombinase XerD
MARAPKFEYRNTPDGWQVNVPATLSESGKRERHFFKTRDAAKDHAQKLREKFLEHGGNAAAIRPSLAEAATLAESILAPWGLSIVEAARMAAEQRERETASKTLADAGKEWLLSCEGLRDRTLRNYKITIQRISATLSDRLLATITAKEIQEAVAPLGTTGAGPREQIRNAKAFWRWSAKKGWCNAEVFNGVEMPRDRTGDEEIGIITHQQAAELLHIAEVNFPQAVSSIAVQLFAGLRSEEIFRLKKSHVTADGINLPADVTKKGRRRHITPNETLSAWLKKYPFTPCSNWRETFAAVRRLAGWEVSARVLNDRIAAGTLAALPKVKHGRWPMNALRHTHASYAVAAGTPLETLLFEFGHAGTPTMLRAHYVGRASKKDALAFFAIRPGNTKAKTTLEAVEVSA